MTPFSFDEQTLVIAENQEEYQALPAWFGSGLVCSGFKLDEREIRGLVKNKFAYLSVLHFEGPVQPIDILADKPEFPIPLDIPLEYNTVYRDGTKATFKFKFSKEDVKKIKETGEIWVVIATRTTPLLPLDSELRWTLEQ